MRKLKSFLFLILSCYCLVSCTSEDNPEYSNRIEGTWTVVHNYNKIRYPENGTWFEHEDENDFTYSESEIRDLDGNLIDVIKQWPFITFFKKKVEFGPTMFKIPSSPIYSAFDTSTPGGDKMLLGKPSRIGMKRLDLILIMIKIWDFVTIILMETDCTLGKCFRELLNLSVILVSYGGMLTPQILESIKNMCTHLRG